MKTLSNFIFLFFATFLGMANNASAYQLKDVSGYHVLSNTSDGKDKVTTMSRPVI